MSIYDFYHPTGIYDLIILSVLILGWDVIGSSIARISKLPKESRAFDWVVGMSVFSFLWWLLKDWAQFKPKEIWTIFFMLVIPLSKKYIRQKNIKGFISFLKENIALFISGIPLFIAIFIKVSLPPYFADEIGYHYYSPSQITSTFEEFQKRDDLYAKIPQGLDNIYRISFALTKSYSVARMVNLSIVISGLISIGSFLNKLSGRNSQIVWLLISPYLASNLPSMGTSGFVDMATGFAVLVATLSAILSYVNREIDELFPSFVFLGIALGFKYSSLVSLVSISLISCAYWIPKLKPELNKKTIKVAVLCSVIFVISGGYWLVNNLIKYSNPIYPFGTGVSNFFTGWTNQISINNWKEFLIEIFYGSKFLPAVLITGLLSVFLLKHRNKFGVITLTLLWLIEILGVKLLNSFIIRYYFHWVFLGGIIIVLALFMSAKNIFERSVKILHLVFVTIFVPLQISNTIRFVYSQEFTPQIEKDYSFRKMSISKWLEYMNPKTFDLIEFCGEPSNEKVRIFVFDPELLWLPYYDHPLDFFVNCLPIRFDISTNNDFTYQQIEQSKSESLYVASAIECIEKDKINNLLREMDSGRNEVTRYPHTVKQRTLNNEIVCNSQRISQNLYSIDKKTLTKLLQKQPSKL